MELPCIGCEKTFETISDLTLHMMSAHRIAVASIRSIPLLSKYLSHYQTAVSASSPPDLAAYAFGIATSGADPAGGVYYLFAPASPDDAALRASLATEAIASLKALQAEEDALDLSSPGSGWENGCFLCSGGHDAKSWDDVLSHLESTHGLVLGPRDRLVFLPELMHLLSYTVNVARACLKCGRVFDTLKGLRNHMRKKKHTAIDPGNHIYDRFFIENAGVQRVDHPNPTGSSSSSSSSSTTTVSAAMASSPSSPEVPADDEDDEGDATEVYQGAPGDLCLFCDTTSIPSGSSLSHMKEVHSVDIHGAADAYEWSIYKIIKLINHVRNKREKYVANPAMLLEQVASHGTYFFDVDANLTPVLEADPIISEVIRTRPSRDGSTSSSEAIVIAEASSTGASSSNLRALADLLTESGVSFAESGAETGATAYDDAELEKELVENDELGEDAEFAAMVAEDALTPCLLCPKMCRDAASSIEHLALAHNVEFGALVGLVPDVYPRLQIINYCRRAIAANTCPFCSAPLPACDNDNDDDASPTTTPFDAHIAASPACISNVPLLSLETLTAILEDESLYLPVLEADPLLQYVVLGDDLGGDADWSSDDDDESSFQPMLGAPARPAQAPEEEPEYLHLDELRR